MLTSANGKKLSLSSSDSSNANVINIRLNCMYSNLIPLNFCVHALKFKLWRQIRYIHLHGLVCKSYCRPLAHKVSLSWLPCSAAERQTGRAATEGSRGWGVREWDAHWPCHHHKPPVWSNILTDWMSVCLGAYQATSPQLHRPLSTYNAIIKRPPLIYYCSWYMWMSLPCHGLKYQ